MLGKILLLILLIALSGVFSASEIAIFSVSDVKLRALVKKGRKWAKELAELKRKPRRLLITILVANNLVNIGASALATVMAIEFFGSYGAGVATGVMTFFILVFGEITPKAYATRHAVPVSLVLGRVISYLMYPLYPIVLLLRWITKMMIGGRSMYTKKPIITEEELKVMVDLGVEGGEVEEKEREMIENVLQFNDITAEDVMTPRTEMQCLPVDMKLEDAMPKILRWQFSRIPLYRNTKDNIVGIVHIMEVVEALVKKRNPKLRQLIYKPYYVPEHKVISQLFKDFQEKQVHMAIVVDEYGGTAGLVTVEDLIEEIVGEISDEYDVDKKHIKRLGKKVIEVSGLADVKEVNRFFNVRLGGKKTDTVSAFLLKKFRKIPRTGEVLRVGGVALYVSDASKKKIRRVHIFKGLRNGELQQKIEKLKQRNA